MTLRKLFVPTLVALLFQPAAQAEITIGVSLPLTGPASGLGIPCNNGLALWPKSIGGETLRVIVLDDASDPTVGVKNARRFVSEDKVDLIVGSAATPVALAMSDVAAQARTVQLAASPIVTAPGKDEWSFRLAQSNAVMAIPVVAHMKKHGVKTVGFLGYSDTYGESWLNDFTKEAKAAGIAVIGAERFARTDTSVTAQALKLTSANPDAILIAASGSGAAMPHKAVVDRGYRGKIYQTHSAASRDLMRVGGKDVEGAFVVSGPATVADQLPDSNPSKKFGVDYIARYEKIHGAGSRNQFAAHMYDAAILLEKAVPAALKKARPGTPEFRAALKEALESGGVTPVSQGIINYTPQDHWGFTKETGLIMKVVNGDWKVEQ
ncbi:MAG: branched-chain amino acid ABC transporter substrate-binding protein [Bordetella sp. SCN 67-23]|nr:ABC transporter substrate-binding protein [Burkholderiales bacterium]ODS68896.1 MAG: branched-chain amino acid ABC transporter substrate-binding protein [Bordetella sp. SCN 67-23]OJW93562.1 MAG: branched-chain amino acid ABC transporter substrate-binding protein [Burkholderiales bacterium 67-32]